MGVRAYQGYKFVVSLYGNNRNDYMGVGLAFPVAQYDLLQTDISCPATAQRWGRKPKPPWPTPAEKAVAAVKDALAVLFWAVTLSPLWLPLARYFGSKMKGSNGKPLYQPPRRWPSKTVYEQAQNKWNRLVYFRLADKANAGTEFGVATYHMPCVFRGSRTLPLRSVARCPADRHCKPPRCFWQLRNSLAWIASIAFLTARC